MKVKQNFGQQLRRQKCLIISVLFQRPHMWNKLYYFHSMSVTWLNSRRWFAAYDWLMSPLWTYDTMRYGSREKMGGLKWQDLEILWAISAFFEKRPLMVNCQNSVPMFTLPHRLTLLCKICPTVNRWNRALFTWQKKIGPPLKLSYCADRTQNIPGPAPSISHSSRFYPNRFTFGVDMAERVKTVFCPIEYLHDSPRIHTWRIIITAGNYCKRQRITMPKMPWRECPGETYLWHTHTAFAQCSRRVIATEGIFTARYPPQSISYENGDLPLPVIATGVRISR